MRHGKYVAACFLLVTCHPLSEIARVVAAQMAQRRIRDDLADLTFVIAGEDVAREIVAARVRSPLRADDGSEPAGAIVLLGSRDGVVPSRLERRHVRRVHERLRKRAMRKDLDDLDGRLGTLSPPEELCERNYLNREVRENEEATTTGGFSAICGWGSSI